MTLILAFEWKDQTPYNDKIVIMSDSRATWLREGKDPVWLDNIVKIVPLNNIVLSTVNLGAIPLPDNSILSVAEVAKEVAERFIGNINVTDFTAQLADSWGLILQRHGISQTDAIFEFIIAEWKGNNSYIHHYYSKKSDRAHDSSQNFIRGAGQEILMNYTRGIYDMSYEMAIRQLKQGFHAVMQKYDSVGGEVHIYELNRNPTLCKWLKI